MSCPHQSQLQPAARLAPVAMAASRYSFCFSAARRRRHSQQRWQRRAPDAPQSSQQRGATGRGTWARGFRLRWARTLHAFEHKRRTPPPRKTDEKAAPHSSQVPEIIVPARAIWGLGREHLREQKRRGLPGLRRASSKMTPHPAQLATTVTSKVLHCHHHQPWREVTGEYGC